VVTAYLSHREVGPTNPIVCEKWPSMTEDVDHIAAPTSSVRDVTPVSIEKYPTAISLNWQPPRHTNGLITGTFFCHLMSLSALIIIITLTISNMP